MNQLKNSKQLDVPFDILTQAHINQVGTPQLLVPNRKSKSRPRTASRPLTQTISPKCNNLICVQRQSLNIGPRQPTSKHRNYQIDIEAIAQTNEHLKRRIMEQTTSVSSQMASNIHKFYQRGGNTAAAMQHIIRGSAQGEYSPAKRIRKKQGKLTYSNQNYVYNSQDQGRSSLAASYSQHSAQYQPDNHLSRQQFSALQMANAYSRAHGSPGRKNDRGSFSSLSNKQNNKNLSKNRDLSPRQIRMLANYSQQQQKQGGRYLASNNQHNYLTNIQEKQAAGQSQWGRGRLVATSSTNKRKLIKNSQQSRPGFDSDSASGRTGSQATHHQQKRGKTSNEIFQQNGSINMQDQVAEDYHRQQQNIYQLNQARTEGRNNSKKGSQVTFGPTRLQNAKSIGLFDLRKHLKKNNKRIMSSKYKLQGNDFDMFSQGPIQDPSISLAEGSQQHLWGPENQKTLILNQSNSGILENMPRGSMTFSNSNLHANTDAATTLTSAAGGGVFGQQNQGSGPRNTMSGFNSKSHLNTLEDDYVQTLIRNKNMSANSQYDKFLHDKFLAQAASKRSKVAKPITDKFIIRKNAVNKGLDFQEDTSKVVTKQTLSKKYMELQREFDKESKRPNGQLDRALNSISDLGNIPSSQVPKRQIDTGQMLTDLRFSLQVQDPANSKMSIGEKMSLTGEIEATHAAAARVHSTALDQYEKQLTQQSDTNQTTYSSKQYKINPLLLDDQAAKRAKAAEKPAHPGVDFNLETKNIEKGDFVQQHPSTSLMSIKPKKGDFERKEIKKLRESFNENYHVLDENNPSLYTQQHPEPGKEPIVLQLEPRQLKDKSGLAANQNDHKPIIKPTQFHEYLKVEDFQRYSSQIEIDQSSKEDPRDNHYKNNSGQRQRIAQNKNMRNDRQNNRATSIKSKTSKQTVKSRDTVVVKTTPQVSINDNSFSQGNTQSAPEQFMNKRQNRIDSIASSKQTKKAANPTKPSQIGMKKKFLETRPIEQEQRILTNENINFELSSQQLIERKLGKSREKIQPLLKEQGLKYSSTVMGQMQPGIPIQHLRSVGNFDSTIGISRIKRSNLQKVDARTFNQKFRIRQEKKQQSASNNKGPSKANRKWRNDHDRLGNGTGPGMPVTATNLQNQIEGQAVAPQMINNINQNSLGYLDYQQRVLSKSALNNATVSAGRGKPGTRQVSKSNERQPAMRKSKSQSRAQAGLATPDSSSMNRVNQIYRQHYDMSHHGRAGKNTNYRQNDATLHDDSESRLQLIRHESGASLNRPSDRNTQGQNMFDIRVRDMSTPDKLEPLKYPNHSLDNTAIMDKVALSNNDYSSPERQGQLSGGKSSQEQLTPLVNRNRSLSVKRIKKNTTNTRSEAFLYQKGRNMSQMSNPPGGQAANPEQREGCDVVGDAQVAALKYKYPRKNFRSVMNLHQPGAQRPSMREHLQRTGRRPPNQMPSRAAKSEFTDFEKEVRQSAETYTAYAKSLYKNVGVNTKKRATSAKAVDIRGLKYKFKVVDIAKYTDGLKYGLFNWPVRYCTIGRKLPNPVERKETLVQEIHFDTLLRILKETDWAKTPLYQQFERHGRWINNDEEIYSEIEINYLSSTLHQMDMAHKGTNVEEFDQNEGQAIIAKHWGKTMKTLQKLMCMMNMMYYFEKLKLQFSKLEAPGSKPSIDELEKLLSRCKKLYNQIDSFMMIFKLVQVKQLRDQQQKGEMTDKEIKKDEVLIKRLIVAICLLLKENPVLPLTFNFGGDCLLQNLKREMQHVKRIQKERKQRHEEAMAKRRLIEIV